MPAVADPGSSVVRAAHDLGMEVVALTGPVSLLLALASSGLNGQSFAFVGYLPQEASERAKRIRELESIALRTGQTQLFIETPYRNAAMLQALLQHLQHNTRLSVSSGLTLAQPRRPAAIWSRFGASDQTGWTTAHPQSSPLAADRPGSGPSAAGVAKGWCCLEGLYRPRPDSRAKTLGQPLGKIDAPRVIDDFLGLHHLPGHLIQACRTHRPNPFQPPVARSRTGH